MHIAIFGIVQEVMWAVDQKHNYNEALLCETLGVVA